MARPLRRVTIPTCRMEESLRFYQDILGLRMRADWTARAGRAVGLREDVLLRVVVLGSDDMSAGMVALLEYLDPLLPVQPFEKRRGQPYPLTLFFRVEDLDDLLLKCCENGVPVTISPRLLEVPGHYVGMILAALDPNGVVICCADGYVKSAAGYSPVTPPTLASTSAPTDWAPARIDSLDDPDGPRVVYAGLPTDPGPATISPLIAAALPVAKGGMTRSLSFYTEVLGLTLLYQDTLQGDDGLHDLGVGPYRVNLAVLWDGQTTHGMVSLMEFLAPAVEVSPFFPGEGPTFPLFFILDLDDPQGVNARAVAFGAPIVFAAQQVPGRPNSGMQLSCLDPSGVCLNLIQPRDHRSPSRR